MMRVKVGEEGAFLMGVSVSVGAPGPVRRVERSEEEMARKSAEAWEPRQAWE